MLFVRLAQILQCLLGKLPQVLVGHFYPITVINPKMNTFKGTTEVWQCISPSPKQSCFICLTIYVEPSQTHGPLLVWSLVSSTIVPSILASPFTAISYSICIQFKPCSTPAYARFWCPNLKGFHFFQRCALQGPISSKSGLGFSNFCF